MGFNDNKKMDKVIIPNKKLVKHIVFKGTMKAISDIHVGGNSIGTQVGGCDNPVMKNSLDLMPYIPGSSIKGKMRMFEEQIAGKGVNGNPCSCGSPDCIICTLFGAHTNSKPSCGQPRLAVRNMYVNKDFLNRLTESGMSKYSIVDIKTSTMINRTTSTAIDGTLRNIEVVSAGTVFDCEFMLRIFEKYDETKLINKLKEMVKHLQKEGLGAKITTGYGQIEFDIDWKNPDVISY